ncbi:MAG: hypothetical protein NVS3B7_05800 [Candidatus Elarobacter sp.]
MSNVTDASSVAHSLRDARVALRSASYDAALELLVDCEDWPASYLEEAVVLKAALIGRRDPVGAVGYLTAIEDLVTTGSGRFNLAIAFGRAHATVRGFSQAESRYADARALVRAVPHGAHTMAYHDLRMRWFRRDCDVTAPEVQLAVTHPDPSIASAAYAYRAWLHAGNGNYAAHVKDLRRAVAYAAMPSAEPVDVSTLAISIHALTQIAFETADTDAIGAAREAVDALAWTSDVGVNHFFTMRALGWDAFMRGRTAEAQWTFKDARALAPSAAFKAAAHLDRAYVARMSGNDFWAAEELAHADALAHGISWGTTFGEERQILVMLATLHASTDAPRAQRYASIYTQIGTENVDPALAIYHDRRAIAHAKYAAGCIDQALGRHHAAIAGLCEAYAIFEQTSFHYWATLTATALAELTGNVSWCAAADKHASAYPNCPLVSYVEVATAREEAVPAKLSTFQRQLARALGTGADTAELSKRFSRSIFTIERQVAAVLDAFGVANRAEFLSESRRRRLT